MRILAIGDLHLPESHADGIWEEIPRETNT